MWEPAFRSLRGGRDRDVRQAHPGDDAGAGGPIFPSPSGVPQEGVHRKARAARAGFVLAFLVLAGFNSAGLVPVLASEVGMAISRWALLAASWRSA